MVSQKSNLEIIHTKLHRPPVPHDLIVREQLLDRLDNRLNRPLSLVCAPAGYGKSTLVSGWIERSNLPVAWLSLNEAENDLRLFLSYFLAAIQTISPEIGGETQALLKGEKLPSATVLAGRLTNDLDEIVTPFILALDDYHLIQNNDVHDLVSGIIKHPPHAMHLVLISRIDPPLPLTSLRAKGQMTEIRVRDLRFSREETSKFLQQMLERTIDESTISLLEEKSEGWITGLRLAALSLRNADDIGSAAASLPDTNRYVLDYFVDEILSQQSVAMQHSLLATSILDRFCGPLCDAVFHSSSQSGSGEINGQFFLQQLKNANLFVIHLDDEGKWFRYHHLFNNLLKQKLEQRFTPDEIGVIHTKAGAWFAENGYFEEAILHTLAGGEIGRAVEIVGHARHDLMNKEQWHRLARWLTSFSHEVIQQNPHLILLSCWLDLYLWYRLDLLVPDLARADVLLANSTLERHEIIVLKAEIAAMRCLFSYWVLKPSLGVAQADQAFRDSPVEHECTRSTAVFGWGPLYQMLGEAKRGEKLLWSHITNGRFKNPSSQARLIVSLCIGYWPEGETRKLQQAASRLLEISLEHRLLWNHSFARYFLGLAHYERNELDEAVEHLQIITDKPYRFPMQNVVHCSFLLSLCYQALGLPEQARKAAKSLAQLTFERENQMFTGLAEAFLADLDLMQGRSAQAVKWAKGFVPPPPHGMQRFFNAELTSIRVMLTINTPESLKSATEQLDSMYQLLEQIHNRRLMIDILGMQALLADTLKQESIAFEKLSESLSLAEPERFTRPFLDLGKQMDDLLKRLVRHNPGLDYAQHILTAFGNEKNGLRQELTDIQDIAITSLPNQALADPLTKREIEILLILSTRLSNAEIAEKLFISPETVKRHLYNIYQKFGVKNRKQVIVRARSWGVI
ncbi:MAG: LuxR family maltose regulon positive regulatory protein [Desulforhopalus sp.]|jgi:LuxR family maltose regulon positive regulatory protein